MMNCDTKEPITKKHNQYIQNLREGYKHSMDSYGWYPQNISLQNSLIQKSNAMGNTLFWKDE
jgi:hypothetical protein